jgi:ElaB/YqjD/DUF883 family membrane-anchored ribosome-binding protein
MNDQTNIQEKLDALSAGITKTISDLMREGKCELKQESRDLSNRALCLVQREPVKALLIAAGVGAVALGVVQLLSRHRSH